MICHLAVNPELYALTFATNDNMHFDLIKNCVRHIPNSKKKVVFNNNQEHLYVYNEYYEQVIDKVSDFLKNNGLETDVYWANKSGILFPCGYYQIAVGSIKNKETSVIGELPFNIKEYFKKVSDCLKTQVYLPYDYFTKMYCIGLKGIDYEDLLLNFNSFVLENGVEPFEKIEVVSRYGKLEQKNYPVFAKRK